MASVNKVILVGNLGRDPEKKYSPKDPEMAITRFTVATAERSKKGEQTEWHNIVCFGRLAEIADQYLKKGRQVYIEGRIQTRSWDDAQSGQKKYMTEIIADNLQFLGNEKSESAQSNKPDQASQPAQKKPPQDDPFLGDFGEKGYGYEQPF